MHPQIVPCSKRFVHDWTECPFAHPQEKARRRDPRHYDYTGIACPSMKKEGMCAFSDHCPYAHNVFEYWLHPTRYRTQLCNDGANCRRKICFFAHSLDELRVPECKPFVSPEALAEAAAAAANDSDNRKKAMRPTEGAISPFAQQQNGQVRASLDVLLNSGADNFSQHASRMTGPSEVEPPAPPRLSSSSSSSGAGEAVNDEREVKQMASQDQQAIDLVTSMLSMDRITPVQAASILQQMLPAQSLASLQSKLLSSVDAGKDVANRGSMDSNRSSFDSMNQRMSVDSALGTPTRRSMEARFIDSPAPAYPQYWTGQQLSPVPEAFPMINVRAPHGIGSVRRSTGSLDLPSSFHENQMNHELGRLSFEDKVRGQARLSDPFASSFYSTRDVDAASWLKEGGSWTNGGRNNSG